MSDTPVFPSATDPAATPRRRVAVIDDALIPPSLSRVESAERERVVGVLASREVVEELTALQIDASADADEILRALAEPRTPLISTFAAIAEQSSTVSEMLQERRDILQLIGLIEEYTGEPVLRCDPTAALPDLNDRDLILIDYYLEGSKGNGDRAKAIAADVRSQHNGTIDQQIVLMSSVEKVREHRSEFRSEAKLSGAAFTFVAKPDMDERWKIKAHFSMLDRARPHAPALTSYRTSLAESLRLALDGLLQAADDLDIGDYAYLQSQALMNDGHPLGDYVSWLLSSHLTTLVFEGDAMRQSQRTLDKLEFENKTFASTEPSTVVAQLFHNALLSSNQGPLGSHPRARTGSPYEHFPLVQLGDVFLDGARSKAIVVLSADCDLAFSPAEARPPEADKPVILVPGDPKSLMTKAAKDVKASTEGVLHGDEIYRIDWRFSDYRSVTLGDLKAWLEKQGFDTHNRDRLRPLYGLKLQQEFGAHLLRVGPPIMPPLSFAAEGKLFLADPATRNLVEEFTNGEIMLSHHAANLVARMTPKLVDALRRGAITLLNQLEEEKDAKVASPDPNEKKQQAQLAGVQAKIDALARELENDDFWIELVNGVALNTNGSSVDKGGVCRFVFGTDWDAPNKPRVVLQITEKSSRAGRAGEQEG